MRAFGVQLRRAPGETLLQRPLRRARSLGLRIAHRLRLRASALQQALTQGNREVLPQLVSFTHCLHCKETSCPRKKHWKTLKKTSAKASRRARKPANSSKRKWSTSAKVSTARARPSRRSRSGFPRRVAPE